MRVNPLMISLNSWNNKDFQSACPVCRKQATLNNENCYDCQLNLRPRQVFDSVKNEELDRRIQDFMNKKFALATV